MSSKVRWVLAVLCVLGLAWAGVVYRRNTADGPSDTPLHAAVKREEVDAVARLLGAGADPNQVLGKERDTCLNAAAISLSLLRTYHYSPERIGRAERILELLASHGANLDQRNRQGDTALVWAARCRDAKTVSRLLRLGANPRTASPDGPTPFFSVVQLKSHYPIDEAVRALSAAKIDINARDAQGRTALHVFVRRIYAESRYDEDLKGIAALLACGADVNARDILGLRPVDYATSHEVAEFLRKHGGKGLGE